VKRQLDQVKEFHDKVGPHSGPLLVSKLIEETGELALAFMENDRLQKAKELADILYVVLGICLIEDVDIEYIFQLVHKSNMTKEKGYYRLRGPKYKPVEM
jgi:NTP pyrophosphatase (non-canonical NTP hydrolase)